MSLSSAWHLQAPFEIQPLNTKIKSWLQITQELVWHIVNNVNIPASKAPLYARSPFLEFQGVVREEVAEMLVASACEDMRAMVNATVRASVDFAASVSTPIGYRLIIAL